MKKMILLLSSSDSSPYFPWNKPEAFTCITSSTLMDSGGKGWLVAVKDVSFELATKIPDVFIFDIELAYAEGCIETGAHTDTVARVHCTPYKEKWVTASFDNPIFHPMSINQIERLEVNIRSVNKKGVSFGTTPSHITLIIQQNGE